MEASKKYDYLFKTLVFGQYGSGQSSTILRIGNNEFSDSHAARVFDFVVKTIDVDGKRVKIQIWDSTGGRERVRNIATSYYRGIMGLMLIYDITSEESFVALAQRFIPEMEKYAPPNAVKMVLGNKCDLEESRAVSPERGKELADKYGYKFMEISAKTGHNTEQALLELAKDIKSKVDSNLLGVKISINPIHEQEAHKKDTSGRCF